MSERNNFVLIYPYILIGMFLALAYSCKKDKEKQIPVLSTTEISDTTITSAKTGGNITSDGGSAITARGICWSTSENPTINNNTTIDGTGIGSYTSNITGLLPNIRYYLQAYAINSVGTGYGNVISFKPKSTVSDIDGNVYHVVVIGTQIWMVENLKVTRYNDGEGIPLVTENGLWAYLQTPGYCWYDNNISNKNPYGAIYNWYVVSKDNLCPLGWHVPTNSEWTTLTDYLGGLSAASGKLKEAGNLHWSTPNADATNESKFTALPGGYRRYSDGSFFFLKYDGTWWSSTSNDLYTAWSRAIAIVNIIDVQVIANIKSFGVSVRCIKNEKSLTR